MCTKIRGALSIRYRRALSSYYHILRPSQTIPDLTDNRCFSSHLTPTWPKNHLCRICRKTAKNRQKQRKTKTLSFANSIYTS